MGNEQILLTVEGHFDAAHNLINYDGPCARMHGHRWLVKAEFGPYFVDDLDDAGLACDFKILKPILHDAIDYLDHEYINNYIDRPSAEWIALRIYRDIARNTALSPYKKIARLHAVEVFESPESKCRVEA